MTTMLPMTDKAAATLSKIGRQHELARTHKCLGKGCYKVCGNAGALWMHQQRCSAFQSYMEEKKKQQARSQTRLHFDEQGQQQHQQHQQHQQIREQEEGVRKIRPQARARAANKKRAKLTEDQRKGNRGMGSNFRDTRHRS